MKNRFLTFIIGFFLSLLIYHLGSDLVFAADYKTVYNVEYRLNEEKNSINSRVDFTINITNLRSDVYVNKFSISFPSSFSISNLHSSDDRGEVIPKIISEKTTRIELEFNNPNTGRNSTNTFHLSFNQANLFKINGNVWEVILPVIENRDDSDYQVKVFLPENSNKKISISKPKPDSITGKEIVWKNPPVKTIYAVFGDTQIYKTSLTYYLKNTNVAPVYTKIAFPPDTVAQKIYLDKINIAPVKVEQDEDGNYLATYFIKPLETKVVTVVFLIQVFSQPREEVVRFEKTIFPKQKSYLLTSQKFWELKEQTQISDLKTADDIYRFTVSKLDYSYDRVTTNNIRLGSQKALENPKAAVCMEFSDLFVAAAREKGIYAREVEGFANSTDEKLRPLSLSSDVLHAWPQYYDEGQGIWKQVDPTWEDTSGIDYFSSFDLNHVVFAIHGKKSDYPLPAGMYKIGNSKDVSVDPTTSLPEDKIAVTVEDKNITSTISDSQKYNGQFSIKNSGNTYLWNIPVEIQGTNLNISNKKFFVDSLAPMQKKEIIFTYDAKVKNKKNEGLLMISVLGKSVYQARISIFPKIYNYMIKGTIGVLVAVCLFFIIKKILSIRAVR